ncbi:ABC transporter substrate-binding protein [Massilia sp. KIM]|uniref:substrate-binding periplasmic protein n=1 Tax=Massilia sp. KIM TaxID=1955422 RepID=UPI001E2B0367|nr:transporter substrate-binding domain-containing protein [Massilia sp. KIM]
MLNKNFIAVCLASFGVMAAIAQAAPQAAPETARQAAAAAPAHAGTRLYITTETSAPSSMLDKGRVVGIATDKVREAMLRAGVTYSIELLPWKRAYTAALQRSDTCVYSTTRTPEREPLFKWVGPTDGAQWVLMGRADRQWRIGSLDEARGLRIGTYNGDARDHFLRERGLQVDAAPNDLINPRKLLLGRIDLWAASLRSGSKVLEQHGWDKQIVPVYVFNRIEVYLACNRGVPDEVVNRLNAAFAEIARDGTGRRIERAYVNRSAGAGKVAASR